MMGCERQLEKKKSKIATRDRIIDFYFHNLTKFKLIW